MFKSFTNKISDIINSIKGRGRITEENISQIIDSVKDILIDADVNFDVAEKFIERLKQRVIGDKIAKSIKPDQYLLKELHEELTNLFTSENQQLNLKTRPPAVILMCGLQGNGKTTTVAKLAKKLQERKKTVLTTSLDIYRPAAMEQLLKLSKDHDFECSLLLGSKSIKDILKNALADAKKSMADVLIVDTAGRSKFDKELMEELKEIQKQSNPVESLLVADSMLGQEAANIAKNFNEAIGITGIILTKTDGDSRGGASISMLEVSKSPIKFIGTGEKIDDFENFDAKRFANRILGQGDILSLIEEAKALQKNSNVSKIKSKINLVDFQKQIKQLSKLGGFSKIVSKLPGASKVNQSQIDNGQQTMLDYSVIIDSMTKKEKNSPELLNASRKLRISKGSGINVNKINQLIQHLKMMQKFSKKTKANSNKSKLGLWPF
jgi:signal recognition particle subunit SRP54